MTKCFCPLSEIAVQQIKSLCESYRLMIAAANDYNGIALANRKQIECAIARADHLGEIIERYLCSYEHGAPCMIYSCGWEYCRRNLEILHAMPDLPDIPEHPNFPPPPNFNQVATQIADDIQAEQELDEPPQ